MATNQAKPEAEQASESGSEPSEPDRHPGYEETTKSAYGSNSDARKAFSDMQIKPSRTQRSSALRKRFKRTAWYHYGSSVECFQWPSGAGLMERTNRQNRGGVTLRMQDGERLPAINVDQLWRFVRDQDADLGLSMVKTGYSGDMRSNAVIEFETGHYVVVLYDRSARARNGSTRAGMFVAPDDPHHTRVERYVNRGDLDKLSDLVAPDDVLASDLPVIDCKSYREGSKDSRWVPDNVGGYGDEDVLGECIIRQGEWYFLPQPDFSPHENEVEKPLNGDARTPLGSHTPRDVVVRDPDQQTLDGESATEPEIYVRGTVRHNRNEHAMFNLYEMWHRVVENTEDMYVFEGRRGGRWE